MKIKLTMKYFDSIECKYAEQTNADCYSNKSYDACRIVEIFNVGFSQGWRYSYH